MGGADTAGAGAGGANGGRTPCVKVDAHAKINLSLSVRPGADATGYHEVETVVCPLELADSVVVRLSEPGAGISLACRPDPLEGDPRGAAANLAYRAAEAFARAFGREPDCAIAVEKAVPAQAGLGGGSADAAAVIRCLAELWGVFPSGRFDPFDARVLEVASGLGADVAACLFDAPVLLTGRGDVPREAFAPFSAPLALVKPDAGVPTVAAYRKLDELGVPPVAVEPVAEALRRGDAPAALRCAGNSMRLPALALAPELRDVFAFLSSGAGVVCEPLLCGSGSCVAAFSADDFSAAELARAAREAGWWSCATRTYDPRAPRRPSGS